MSAPGTAPRKEETMDRRTLLLKLGVGGLAAGLSGCKLSDKAEVPAEPEDVEVEDPIEAEDDGETSEVGRDVDADGGDDLPGDDDDDDNDDDDDDNDDD